jgi:hypothetical protein
MSEHSQSSLRGIRFFVDPLPRDMIYPCTIGELKAQLRRVPAEYVEGLVEARLCNQFRNHAGIDADYADGGFLRIFPYPASLTYPASPTPHAPSDREWLQWGAEVYEQDGVRLLRWTREALRGFILGHVLLHELGHHYLWKTSRRQSEKAAEQIAFRLAKLLAAETPRA